MVALALRKAVVAPQFFAHLPQQFVAMRVAKVAHFDARGIAAPARRADRQHAPPTPRALRDQQRLVRHQIHAIDHPIELRLKQTLRRFLGEKFRHARHATLRVDQLDPVGERIDFRPADIAVERGQLPVDVRHAHVIEIDHRDRADPGAREAFDDPRAHAADAHHAHVRRLQTRQRVLPVKAAKAAEPLRIIAVHALRNFPRRASPRRLRATDSQSAAVRPWR